MAADMTYDGNLLKWGADVWTAVSGPHKRGRLPAGLYSIERRNITGLSSEMEDGYIDPTTGQGFFLPISPQFSTDRDGLGIHPDGNVPGTEGCIGLKSNTLGFYNRIAATAPSAKLTLEVSG